MKTRTKIILLIVAFIIAVAINFFLLGKIFTKNVLLFIASILNGFFWGHMAYLFEKRFLKPKNGPDEKF